MDADWPTLAAWSGARLVRSGARPARGASVDSRAVRPDDLFVALKGERVDGHDFMWDAAARGAAGALGARAGDLPEGFGFLEAPDPLAALQRLAQAHRSRRRARVIGVTGSNGKTTTKDMLAHLLGSRGPVLATRGNLNSAIGLPLVLLDLEERHGHAVLEMGASAPGDIARLSDWARPHLGVITGIGRAHLATFGSLEGVLAAKWELVEALPRDGIAFLNADDPRLMSRRASARPSVVLFGRGPEADVRAENVRQDPQTVFDLVVGGARRTVRLPVPGLFNVANALAAAAVAVWERMNLTDVARELGRFTPPGQRMEMRRRRDGSLFILDAYNANPDSMAASLASVSEAFPHWPRVAVLGSMRELGPSAEEEHRALGRALAGLDFAHIFFLGPEGAWVEEGYRAANGRGRLVRQDDRETLRRLLAEVLTPETVAFFKASRGVKLEEVYEPFLAEGAAAPPSPPNGAIGGPAGNPVPGPR